MSNASAYQFKQYYYNPRMPLALLKPDDISAFDESHQIDVMWQWFTEHYGSPKNLCPNEPLDGGYQFIYGGPYDAKEELEREFGGFVGSKAIEKLVEKLNKESLFWSGLPDPEDNFYEIDAALELDESNPRDAVRIRLGKLRRMLNQKELLEAELQDFQRMMIFTFCITTMESFLSDVFVRKVMANPECKEKFLSADKVLSEEKLLLSEIFKRQKELDVEVKKRLMDITFHHLPNVAALYKKVIGIQLNEIIRPLIPAVEKRHDIIHRAGRDKEGNPVGITVEEIRALIDQVDHLCGYVDACYTFAPVVVAPPPVRG